MLIWKIFVSIKFNNQQSKRVHLYTEIQKRSFLCLHRYTPKKVAAETRIRINTRTYRGVAKKESALHEKLHVVRLGIPHQQSQTPGVVITEQRVSDVEQHRHADVLYHSRKVRRSEERIPDCKHIFKRKLTTEQQAHPSQPV